MYGMYTTKMVINFQRDLETLSLNKDEDCEKHVGKFHLLTAKMDLFEKPLSSKDKVYKIPRNFSKRLKPIAMVTESSSVQFRKIIASVKAEVFSSHNPGRKYFVSHVDATEGVRNRKDNFYEHENILKNRHDPCFV